MVSLHNASQCLRSSRSPRVWSELRRTTSYQDGDTRRLRRWQAVFCRTSESIYLSHCDDVSLTWTNTTQLNWNCFLGDMYDPQESDYFALQVEVAGKLVCFDGDMLTPPSSATSAPIYIPSPTYHFATSRPVSSCMTLVIQQALRK